MTIVNYFDLSFVCLPLLLGETDGYTYWRIDLNDLYHIKSVDIFLGDGK